MSNTEDTPIDYKQFEGATPGPWQVRTEKEFIKPKTFEIINHQGLVIASVNIGMFDVEQNSRLLAAAPDLLKENQSLKLELQKQKKLNAELVKGLEAVLRLRQLFEFKPDEFIGAEHEGEAVAINRMIFLVESLIKKSSEL